MRQRLKPFAPRIVGTRDGRDRERAKLLADAWRMEIVPRVLSDFGDQAGATDRRTEALLGCRLAATDAASAEELAWAIARLIAHYAHKAGYRLHDWYWLKSIDLLDRLCDVDGGSARVSYGADQATVPMLILDQNSKPRVNLASAALTRIRSLIAAGTD